MHEDNSLPQIGDVIRYAYGFVSGQSRETQMFYMEARVAGTEADPVTIHMDNTMTLVREKSGWKCPHAFSNPVTAVCLWNVDGEAILPGRGSFPLPERAEGMPFPGQIVTVTVSDNRKIRTSVIAVSEKSFRMGVYPNEWVGQSGKIKDSEASLVSMIDEDGLELLVPSPAAGPAPRR